MVASAGLSQDEKTATPCSGVGRKSHHADAASTWKALLVKGEERGKEREREGKGKRKGGGVCSLIEGERGR